MLATHEQAYKIGRPEAEGVAADLLRAIIVFSVASFDAYLHKRIIEVVVEIINSKKRVPQKTVSIIISQVKKINGNERDIEKISKELLDIAINPSPVKKIEQLLEKGLAGQTFQKAEHVIKVGKMMEVENIWKAINKSIHSAKKGPKKKGPKQDYAVFLDDFIERRDMIVHEADTYSSKKLHGNLRKITRTEVRNGMKDLKKIVNAIEKISTR